MRKISMFMAIWTGFMIVLEITRRILWQSNCSPEIVDILRFHCEYRLSYLWYCSLSNS